MTELRAQFELFRRLREGAERLLSLSADGAYEAAAKLARADIKNLLYLLVDVVIQFGVENHERFVKEIWYDPERKRRCLASTR